MPNTEFFKVENGGHLLIGHQSMVGSSINNFIKTTKNCGLVTCDFFQLNE